MIGIYCGTTQIVFLSCLYAQCEATALLAYFSKTWSARKQLITMLFVNRVNKQDFNTLICGV